MITLVSISVLGFLCLILEILNLRKILVPTVLLALLGILGLTLYEYTSGDLLLANDSFGMVQSTKFSQLFSILFIILAVFLVGMSPHFYKKNIDKLSDYISIKIFMLAGAVAMVSFGHLAMFFLGLEVLSIGGYILASSSPTSLRSNEAGLKYFIMGAFASGFIVLGIAFLYGATGSFAISTITNIAVDKMVSPIWYNAGLILILVGLFFKASLAPFHFWAPDVYEGSPKLVTAMMSTLVKIAAVAALFKIGTISSDLLRSANFEVVLTVMVILSLTIGNITALKQKNIKRMMAYSGISHAGFMLMPLLSTGNSTNTLLYYASAYSFAAITAFAVIIAVCKEDNNEDIDNFAGLAKRSPILAISLTGALLSLAGIPVFSGFFAKLFMFRDMLESNQLLLVIVGVVNSIIALYYYISVINIMYAKQTDKGILSVNSSCKIVAIIGLSLTLLLGVFPSLIMDIF